MIITEEFIKDNSTPKGGWKRKQLEILGESWPPQPGWIKRSIGKEITAEQREEFIKLRNL